MAGRLSIASVLAAAALFATPATASEPVSNRDVLGRVPTPVKLQAVIEALFNRQVPPSIETPTGVTGEPETMEVVMVRIKDGKPVMACVDSKEAAVRFLTAPVEKIGTTKIAEEK